MEGSKRRKVDLNSSDMSIDMSDTSTMEVENDRETVSIKEHLEVKAECAKWKARAEDLEQTLKNVEQTLKNLEPVARLFGREKTRGTPTPTVEMSKLIYTELALG